jgi:hypothetical protein
MNVRRGGRPDSAGAEAPCPARKGICFSCTAPRCLESKNPNPSEGVHTFSRAVSAPGVAFCSPVSNLPSFCRPAVSMNPKVSCRPRTVSSCFGHVGRFLAIGCTPSLVRPTHFGTVAKESGEMPALSHIGSRSPEARTDGSLKNVDGSVEGFLCAFLPCNPACMFSKSLRGAKAISKANKIWDAHVLASGDRSDLKSR